MGLWFLSHSTEQQVNFINNLAFMSLNGDFGPSGRAAIYSYPCFLS